MYSSGMPFTYVILFVTLILIFYIDKYLIFSFYKRSKVISDKALLHFVLMLKAGIILHIFTGSLMFMNRDIF
jgi:hypothetical protein